VAIGQAPAPLPHLGLVFSAVGFPLTLAAGSFTVSGQAVTTRYGHKLPIEAAAFTLSGQDIDLDHVTQNSVGSPGFLPHIGLVMDLSSGVFALPLATGTFTLTGNAIATPTGFAMPLGTGSFVLTGAPADVDIEENLDAGSFAVSGQTLALARTYTSLALGTGSFALTGQQVSLNYEQVGGLALSLQTASYTLSGQALTFGVTRRMTLEAGSFVMSGKALVFDSILWVKVDPASSTWTPVEEVETEWAEAA
jgi:hypothetical protein